MSSVFFFGAGASIDGGLDDAFKLTQNIYDRLVADRDTDAAKVYGLVVAKIIARKVRDGGTPFDRVNVEEVYDGIQRLANRDTDILSDFVAGWDPALASLRMNVRESDVERAFGSLLSSYGKDNFSGRMGFRFGSDGAKNVLNLLNKLIDPSLGQGISKIERSLQRALVDSLQFNKTKIKYFEELIKIAKANSADIVTLNYDLIAESSADSIGLSYDYGLTKWNTDKVVSFSRSSAKNIRILKLHGSLNWFAAGDDIDVKEKYEKDKIRNLMPNMIFGEPVISFG